MLKQLSNSNLQAVIATREGAVVRTNITDAATAARYAKMAAAVASAAQEGVTRPPGEELEVELARRKQEDVVRLVRINTHGHEEVAISTVPSSSFLLVTTTAKAPEVVE